MNSKYNCIKLYSLNNYLFLTNEVEEKCLIIRRNPIKIFEKSLSDIKEKLEKFKFKIFEKIIGIITINKLEFLILLEKSNPVYEIRGKDISIIKNIKMVNIKILNFEDKENLKESLPRIEGIKKLLERNFYFSNHYDLFLNLNDQIRNLENFGRTKFFEEDKYEEKETLILSINFKKNNIENQKANNLKLEVNEMNEDKNQVNIEEDENIFSDFNEYFLNLVKIDEFKYIWNTNSLNYFKDYKISKNWFCFIIQGFIKLINGKISNDLEEFDYIIFSKRSYKKGGTRYNCRGINKEGYASNFVDTEEIIIHKNKVFSMNQIRGSIPFFWKQKPGNNFLKIDEDLNKNQNLFNLHYSKIKKFYKYILSINLLSKHKEDEIKLTKYFLNYHKDIENEQTEIKCFDYHKNNKNGDFTILNNHLSKNFENILKNKEIIPFRINELKQNLILRTNCLDSLDRTNAYQAKIALFLLAYFYNEVLNYDDILSIYRELLLICDNQEINQVNFLGNKESNYIINFIKEYNHIWADNGDEISYSYTGTGATTSMVTRQGKKNLKSIIDHSFKTVSRFYLNVFEDSEKQKDIDSFLNHNKIIVNDSKKIRIKTVSICMKGNKLNQFSFTSWLNLFLDNMYFELITISYQRSENDTFQLDIDGNVIVFKDFFSMILYIIKEINEKFNKKFYICYKDSISTSGIIILSSMKKFEFKITQKLKKLNSFYDFGIFIINVCFSYNNTFFSLYNIDFNSKIVLETKINKIKGMIQKINLEKNNYFCIFLGYFNFKIKYQNIYLKKEGMNLMKSLENKELENEEIIKISEYDEFVEFNKNILLEGLLNFYPNSFYKCNSKEFISDKNNPPYWSERILFYFNKKNMNVLNDILKILNYNLIEDFDKGNYRGISSLIEINFK